jgi:4'-phosphopantetheinyl transferase
MELFWPESPEVATLPPGEAHIWAVPLSGVGDIDELLRVLSPAERRRAEQFRWAEARKRFAAARAGLRAILGRYLGLPAAAIVLADGAHGKPRLSRAEHGLHLHFNVAHSGDLALVAVSANCEIGVDVERLRPVSHWEEIAIRYFHEAEVQKILARSSGEREVTFLRCWTAKEAVLKALGVGLTGSLREFQVPIDQHDGRWVEVPRFRAETPARIWLQRLAPDGNYSGAVALAGKQCCIRCFTFRW